MTSPSAPIAQHHYSAGILPMTVVNDTVYFMLGQDRMDSTYSDFGGRVEESDNNNPKMTAAREFYEESAGCIMDIETMMKRLNASGCSLLLMSKTMGNAAYYMYVVSVPYMSHYTDVFSNTSKFLRYAKAHRRFLEKARIQWVAVPELIQATDARGGGVSSKLLLRGVFANTVCVHRDTILSIRKYVTHRYPSPNKKFVTSTPKSPATSGDESEKDSQECVNAWTRRRFV